MRIPPLNRIRNRLLSVLLALPFLFVIAGLTGQPVHWPGRRLGLVIAAAAFFFAADLAAWHVGIHMTKLGNATLFGNITSFEGQWVVVSGTGIYANLHGHGERTATLDGTTGVVSETLTGEAHFD